MKKLILLSTFFILFSCGGDDKNSNPAGPIVNPVTPTEVYSYRIVEMNSYSDVICSTGRIRNFNSFQEMCNSIFNEYNQGRCDRACSKILYESVKCGTIPEEFNSYSCGNYYNRSMTQGY